MAAAPHAAHTDRDDAPEARPALTALLDHLAEEVAHEYVRLMEQAARDEAARLTPPSEGA